MAFCLPKKKGWCNWQSGLVHSLYYIYKISIKPISLNCQIELHQPNKNPHRSNASPTSLTQSLYYIYKMSLNLIIRTDVYRETNTVRGLLRTLYYIYKNTLNLFLNFCLSYQDRAEHSSKPINKHQQKWLKLFLLEGKKSSWSHYLCTLDRQASLLLVRHFFQSKCYLFVILVFVILVILQCFNEICSQI